MLKLKMITFYKGEIRVVVKRNEEFSEIWVDGRLKHISKLTDKSNTQIICEDALKYIDDDIIAMCQLEEALRMIGDLPCS